MREIRYGPHKLYKGKFFVVFYDETDEKLKYIFNNVREILSYQHKEITKTNVNLINNELYLALRREGHFTRFLNGELLRVYIIDCENEYDYEIV